MRDKDKLVGVETTTDECDIMLFASSGKVIRFEAKTLRSVGRGAIGVRGIRLQDDDFVVSMVVVDSENPILTATEFGYGKRTNLSEYRTQTRGGKGSISIKTNERNGKVIGSIAVSDNDDMMLISNKATLVRTRSGDVSVIGRNTSGVKLINISKGEKLVSIARVAETGDDESENIEEEL